MFFDEIHINSFHQTALHIAVEKENIPIIKLLLSKQDININIKNGIFFDCLLMILLLYMNDFHLFSLLKKAI